MKTITVNVYSFNELSDEAKKKAREWYRDGGFDFEWWDFVYDDSITIAGLMGIDISKIYFSGFYSQGDGACFEGYYSYKINSVNLVKEYAPEDKELRRIIETLQAIQKKHFYKLSANVKHRGHYYHENCTEIQVYKDGNYLHSESELQAEDEISECLRDFMMWIYKSLENNWDYLNSDESVDETIEANDYEFDESGNLI